MKNGRKEGALESVELEKLICSGRHVGNTSNEVPKETLNNRR